jgi:hypothetical protein
MKTTPQEGLRGTIIGGTFDVSSGDAPDDEWIYNWKTKQYLKIGNLGGDDYDVDTYGGRLVRFIRPITNCHPTQNGPYQWALIMC